MVESLLDRVLVPKIDSPEKASLIKEKSKPVDFDGFLLGTPGSVLGIHSMNAFSQKPRNREERIEMKSNISG